MAIQHHNTDYSGGFPTAVGDRYNAQDLFRDFWYGIAQTGEAISRITSGQNARLRGDNIVQGATVNEIDIPEQYCLARYQVTVPDNIATLPGTTQTQNIFVPFTVDQALGVSLSTATLDGSTVNYVKASYSEVDDPIRTRNRAELAGSYSYEKIPTGVITINSTAPTDFEVSIATFVGDGATTLTITQQPVYNIPQTVDGSTSLTNLSLTNINASGQIDTVDLNVTGELDNVSTTTSPISRVNTSSANSLIDYPVGQYLSGLVPPGDTVPLQNATVTVRTNGNPSAGTWSDTLINATSGGSVVVPGTWVCRGSSGSGGTVLIQRIA